MSPGLPAPTPAHPAQVFPAREQSPWQTLVDSARARPEEAVALVRRLPGQHDRKAASTAVLLGIADRHPRVATLAAWDLELGRFAETETEATLLEKLAQRWASEDLSAALEWAATLPRDEDRRRDDGITGIARAAVDESPSIAARIIVEAMSPDDAAQSETIVEIARCLAARNRDDAIAWLAHFPDGPALELGIVAVDRAGAARPSAGRPKPRLL